jgi:hypothetical protein
LARADASHPRISRPEDWTDPETHRIGCRAGALVGDIRGREPEAHSAQDASCAGCSDALIAGEDDVATVNCALDHHRRKTTPDHAAGCRGLDSTRNTSGIAGLIDKNDRSAALHNYASSPRHHYQGPCWPCEEALRLCTGSASTRACFR